MYDYAIKDGDVVAGGLERPTAGTKKKNDSFDLWSEIAASETAEEFWDKLQTLAPRQMLCNFNSMHGFANWKFRPQPEAYISPPHFQFNTTGYPALETWVRQHLRLNDRHVRGQSLILWGGTRTGKTSWARSLGRHAYYCGLWSYDEPLDGVEYAIFDDLTFGWKGFPMYKQWLGQQERFFVTDKYRGKKRIDWGLPCIYLCNDNPLESPDVDHNWLTGNCLILNIEAPGLIAPDDGGAVDSSWEM